MATRSIERRDRRAHVARVGDRPEHHLGPADGDTTFGATPPLIRPMV